MKKINQKKLIPIYALLAIIIIATIIFGISKSKSVINITAKIVDNNAILENEICTLVAEDGGDSGYYIVLPDVVNTKIVKSYFIVEKPIKETEGENVEKTTSGSEGQEKTIQKTPGDKIYLTESEVKDKKISLKATYDTKQVDGRILYNKKLEETLNQKNVLIQGYMPIEGKINTAKINIDETKITEAIKNKLDKNAVLDSILNIEIIPEKESNPFKLSEDIKIIITEFDNIKEYTVVSLGSSVDLEKDKINLLELENIKKTDNEIIVQTKEMQVLAIVKVPNADASTATKKIATKAIPGFNLKSMQIINSGVEWDGSVATSFKYGTGSARNTIFNNRWQ